MTKNGHLLIDFLSYKRKKMGLTEVYQRQWPISKQF